MSDTAPRIALIHGTAAAMAPAVAGILAEFPGAEVWNLLDDKLLTDAVVQGGLTPDLCDRMTRLIDYSLSEGAAGVLLTCSMYGEVAQGTIASVPVLAPDQAAFENAMTVGYARILLVAAFETALNDAVARFTALLRGSGSKAQVLGLAVPAAFAATKAGDPAALTTALIEATTPFIGSMDVVLLGQYSLAPAAAALSEALRIPVLSGPQAAALKLKGEIERQNQDRRDSGHWRRPQSSFGCFRS